MFFPLKSHETIGFPKEATSSLRGLDLAKFEELVAVAPAAAASALYGYKGSTPTPEMFTKAGRVRVGTVGRFWGNLEETWMNLGKNGGFNISSCFKNILNGDVR